MANQEVEASGTQSSAQARVLIPTIESQLRVRRLKGGGNFLHRVSLQLHQIALRKVTLDVSLAIRTALLDTLSFETNLPQITQLLDDAKELCQMHDQAQQTHCNFEVPNEISDEFWRWVATYQMKIWLNFTESIELIPCPQCGRTFRGVKGSPRIVEASTVLRCKSFQDRTDMG